MFDALFPVSTQSFPKVRGISWLVSCFAKWIQDPLFWALYISLSALCLPVSMIAGPALVSPLAMILLPAFAMAGSLIYIYRRKKEIFYESSLFLLLVRNFFAPARFPWWNQIDEGLYLGGIPLQEKGHLEGLLQATNVSAILSLLEDFELANRWPMTTPVPHVAWEQQGFETLQIGSVDLEGTTLEEIERGVVFLRTMRLQGRHVYVHCKAGLGRSATVVACYLLRYGRHNGQAFSSVSDVINYVLEQRREVHLDKARPASMIQQYAQKLTEI